MHSTSRLRDRAARGLRSVSPACRIVALVIYLGVGWVAGVDSQTSSARITHPEEGAFVSGATELAAQITGGGEARVTFFADGVKACELNAPPFRCTWQAGRVLRPHTIRVVAVFADGSRSVHTIRTGDPGHTESVQVDAVQVTLSVLDRRGRFVRGLERDAFRLFEDDVPQRISGFAAEDASLEVVVAIDVSGSMKQAMPHVQGAVRRFLTTLPTRYGVTVLAFNDNVFTLVQQAHEHAERTVVVDDLAAWGGTRLFDAMLEGVRLLQDGSGRKALIVFSDGDDVASRTSLNALEARLEASDVTVYTIGLGRGSELKELKALLERLATKSGGRAFATEKPTELQRAFEEIVEELSNQYLLSYEPTNARWDGTWRRIRVESQERGHVLRARNGYRAVRQ